jgi:selenocysteine-specific elongation factor
MIVATAGHVDHGKTSLVKHLTGVDTDSLEEEKRRGLTINLGYAYLNADANTRIGLIDVPGHSRFINTMIAGVSGIDLALVVVAADEGPMPQTMEHLEVLRLLGIDQYAIVITHIDRVENPRLTQVTEVLQSAMGGQWPVFEINNIDGSGVDDLKSYLLQMAIGQQAKSQQGYFRLSIDRSFLLNGIGLVVTGTAISGLVSEGDRLFLLPKNREVRVRAIHSQNEKSITGQVGQRCALQLAGIEKGQVSRGDWLHASAQNQVSSRINVRLEMSGRLSFKVKHLCPVKLYIGAKLQSAKLYLLERQADGNELGAGSHVLAQLIIDGPISCCRGDRFILRDSSESTTLGGGIVLDPYAVYSSSLSKTAKNYLRAMELPTQQQTLHKLLIDQQGPVNLSLFKQACNLQDADLAAVLQQADLPDKSKAFSLQGQDYLVANQYWENVEKTIIDYVQCWHGENPGAEGIQASVLLVGLQPVSDSSLFWSVLDNLLERGLLRRANGCISIKGFKSRRSAQERQQWQLIERALSQYSQQIPTLANLQNDLQLDSKSLDAVLHRAVVEGRLFKLGSKRFVLFEQLSRFALGVNQVAVDLPRFSVADIKNHLQLGRNSSVELLEYFDHIGFTRRHGQSRAVLDTTLPERMFRLT